MTSRSRTACGCARKAAPTWIARPTLRTVDASGQTVLVVAGDQVDDALTIARMQARGRRPRDAWACRATRTVRRACSTARARASDSAIDVRAVRSQRAATMDAALADGTAGGGAITRGRSSCPALRSPERFRGALCETPRRRHGSLRRRGTRRCDRAWRACSPATGRARTDLRAGAALRVPDQRQRRRRQRVGRPAALRRSRS